MSNTISLDEWEAKHGQKKRRTRGAGGGGGGTEGPDAEAEIKFSMTSTGGLFRRIGTAEPPKWEHVAQPFEILGCVRDLANARGERDGWGRLIRFRDRDGVERDVMVCDAELHSDAGKLAAMLADKGMAIQGTLTARRALAEYLLSAPTEKRVTVVRCVGWQDAGYSAFMLTDNSIIKGDG
jgi:Domain of unknown function (DUF927)